MITFENDYNRGAHAKILERLMEINMDSQIGYGLDVICDRAKQRIREACGCPNAEVYFTVGGTQTNQLVIDTVLRSYEGVIAVTTGHVAGHESGAIEFSGHKVLTLPQKEGKMDAAVLRKYMEDYEAEGNHEHMVFPGMVYISYPTEYGTLYSKQELEELSEVCHQFKLPLYIDGARMGYGLMSDGVELSLSDIAHLCDVFYIGGTKVGAMFGEAIVFSGMKAPEHFMALTKQHGALMAKGWMLGVQFDVLFGNDLYFEISKHAIEMANRVRKIFKDKGYKFFLDTPTNQVFVILDNAKVEQISAKMRISVWEKYDENHTVIRFVTSWATTEEDIKVLEEVT